MSASELARLNEFFRGSGPRLWVLQSRARTCDEVDAAFLRLLRPGHPSSYPGVSLLVTAKKHSADFAAALVHLRDLLPTFPIACLLPEAQDPFGAEVVRLCGLLRIRWACDEPREKPEVSLVEGFLRHEPARFGVEVVSFLSARGHAVPVERLRRIAAAVWEGRMLAELGPRRGSSRKEWLRAWGRRLRRAGLPPLKELVPGLRVVAAGVRLCAPERPSVEEVAHKLGFSGEPALSRAMLLRFNVRPLEVRDLYPFEWMLDRAIRRRAPGKGVKPPRAPRLTFSPWLGRRTSRTVPSSG